MTGPTPALPPTSCDTERVSVSPQGPDPASVTYRGSKCWAASALVGTTPPNSAPPTGLAMDQSAVSGHMVAAHHPSVLP